MANPITVDQLKAGLKKWFPNGGYEFRSAIGRPGTFTPSGFNVHHTGGPYTDSDSYLDFLFITGRPDEGIPGQLCQFAIGGSGKLYIGDMDRANQAGRGSSSTLSKIRSENYPGYTSEIEPGPDDTDGNAWSYGVEICYPGTLPPKPAQYATAVRLGAMIVDLHGWSALSCFAHREWSDRKWDPGHLSLVQYRKDVRARLLAGPGGVPDVGDVMDYATFKKFMGQFIRDIGNAKAAYDKALNAWVVGGGVGTAPAATYDAGSASLLSAIMVWQVIGRHDPTNAVVANRVAPNVHRVFSEAHALYMLFQPGAALYKLLQAADDSPEIKAEIEAAFANIDFDFTADDIVDSIAERLDDEPAPTV